MYDKFLLTGNTITVPAGQHIDVQLPDGTKVCMNALSELHYPTFFIGRERKVQLKGEAFFDVSHDRKHPFVVETYACDVEVLGTKFNVKARSEDGEFVASLVEGKVRVTDRFNSNNQVELHPREQVTHLNGRLILGRIPEHEGFLWREGLIAFRDASFGDLLDQPFHREDPYLRGYRPCPVGFAAERRFPVYAQRIERHDLYTLTNLT